VPLINALGDQNCFLNVLIHWIYNTKELKKFFLEVEIEENERNKILTELQVYKFDEIS
jgi:hypothetical protein